MDVVQLDLPAGARPLPVAWQHGALYLWAQVDPEAATTPRWFRIAGTGHDIAERLRSHVGSVLSEGGAPVLHVFETAPPGAPS